MELSFSGTIWYWRGPAPFYFVTVPPDECEVLQAASRFVTYGWGMIPARVRVGSTEWETSLWPKEGLYVVPLKASVRKAENLAEGQDVELRLFVGAVA
ncbi:MAG TPA: DUF1905 domain-containing protein [Trueperaceae bacterium]